MSPRSEVLNQRIRDDQVKNICYAATKVFAQRGLAATKITDIAAYAGVSHGLVYHYFPTKEAIFTILIEAGIQELYVLHQGLPVQPGSPLDRLTWMVRRILLDIQENPEQFMILIQALINSSTLGKMRDVILREIELCRTAIRKQILEGQRSGQIVPGDPSKLTTLFFSSFEGLFLELVYQNIPPQALPNAEEALRLLRA